jgi:anthranilate phosphoribosyltransferase
MKDDKDIGFIKRLVKFHSNLNVPLSFDDGYKLGSLTIESLKSENLQLQIQTNALLTALHNVALYYWQPGGPNMDDYEPLGPQEQIAGICAAVFEQDIDTCPNGNIKPDKEFVVDNCGMGGDMIVTSNVSTLAALIASAYGIPVCKHGSPSNADQGKHGSSDFVSLMGLDTMKDPVDVVEIVNETNFGYTEALDTRYKRIHLQTHEIAKMPHMNDLIGPITNPLDRTVHTRKIIGVNHLVPPKIVAEAYRIMNERGITHMNHLVCVRGFVGPTHEYGVDEVSVCESGTVVSELLDGKVNQYRLCADDFGISPLADHEVSPPSGMSKGDFSLAILTGEIEHPAEKMVCANAAMVLKLNQPDIDLWKAYQTALDILKSGQALTHLEKIKKAYSDTSLV